MITAGLYLLKLKIGALGPHIYIYVMLQDTTLTVKHQCWCNDVQTSQPVDQHLVGVSVSWLA